MVSLPLINLWNKRSLIIHFSIIDIKLRYKGTYLGFLWAALEPIFMFMLLYVVFTSIREGRREDFAIYLITGTLLYHLFARGTMGGLSTLATNYAILNSLNIRRELFPVVSVTSVSLLLLVEVAVLFGLMPIFQFVPYWTIVLLPMVMILFLILVLGAIYLLSIIYVFAKDIQQIWGVFSYSLIFVSPIFWYLDEANGILLQIQKINPLGQLIELAHKVVLGTVPPLSDWLYTCIFVFGILFAGYALFQKYEKNIAEKV